MKVLLTLDTFKGTYNSIKINKLLKKELYKKDQSLNISIIPNSDGGEGSLEVYKYYLEDNYFSFEEVFFKAPNPISHSINNKGRYLYIKDKRSVFIESASFIGLSLIKYHKDNAYKTTSYPLGIVINEILSTKDVGKIIIGLGGSSTNDGGTGMLEALGVEFFDIDGHKLINLNGEQLIKIKKMDITNINSKLSTIEFVILSDVTNPFVGVNGATYVYGPQKGLEDNKSIKFIEEGMKNYLSVLAKTLNKNYLSLLTYKGGGSAGGLGLIFHLFFNSKVYSGSEYFSYLFNMEKAISFVDALITGEGQLDDSSFNGKTISYIYRLSKLDRNDKKLILLVGRNKLNNKSLKLDVISLFRHKHLGLIYKIFTPFKLRLKRNKIIKLIKNN